MIKSTSEAVGTGLTRTVTIKKRSKPITALFPGLPGNPGSFSTFGKPLGEMKVVKKTFWGLLGNYTRYVEEFVPYEEDDFIDNKVLNGGGGSGVPEPTPLPENYVVPPIEGLKVNESNPTSITVSWAFYPDDPENPTYGFVTYIDGIKNKNIEPSISFTFPALTPDTEYVLGIRAIVTHNGEVISSIIKTVNAKTLVSP
jgi:hypothetical protein